MLVLSRQQGEQIVIDGSVVVTVLEIRGNRVKLGVVAPGNTGIYRGEVRAEIRRQQDHGVIAAEAATA